MIITKVITIILFLQEGMNLTLPEWIKDYYPHKLIPLTLYSLRFNTYNDEFRRLKGGPMLKKIVSDMLAKREGTLQPEKRKMLMFVGHDSTIVDLLNTMYIWHNQLPHYNIMTMIELHEDENEWNVQVSNYTTSFLVRFSNQIAVEKFKPLWMFLKIEKILKFNQFWRSSTWISNVLHFVFSVIDLLADFWSKSLIGERDRCFWSNCKFRRLIA